jgi:hypothetical protein
LQNIILPIFRLKACIYILTLLSLCLGPWATSAFCASVTLAWDANTEPDLSGYILHYGTASRAYSQSIDVGNAIQYTISDLQEGVQYFFAVKAYNYDDNQSGFSEELVYTIPTQDSQNNNPAAPSVPSGPSSGYQETSYSFTTTAADPDGDSLNYRFDWGDGAVSGWGAATRSHTWSATGNFCVRARARDSQGATSDWSSCRNIAIAEYTHTITASAEAHGSITPSGSITVTNGSDQSFTIAADQGYRILDVEVDGASVGALSSYQFENVTGDHEIRAGFEYIDQTPPDDDSGGDQDSDNETPDNTKPDSPVLLSPSDRDVVALAPVLTTDAYYDPDADAAHAKTRWQIFRKTDEFCVLDLTTSKALTSLTVPKLVLEEDTDYVWQVRFIDNQGSASDWSDAGYFTTDFDGHDRDGNGILDDQEVDASADLDGDGTFDHAQDHIKCVQVAGSSAQIGISIKGADNVQSIDGIESENADAATAVAGSADKPLHFPFGLIDFKLTLDQPGAETTIAIYLSEAAPARGKLYKYNVVDDSWADYSADTDFRTDRKSFDLTLRDGGPGDADGTANGIIVDPLGVGAPAEAVASAAAGESGGGGGSGCFITSAAHKAEPDQFAPVPGKIPGPHLVIMLLVPLLFCVLRRWVTAM